MSAKASIVAVAGGILALALGLGWRGGRAERAAQAALEAAAKKRAAADVVIRRMEDRIASGDRDWARLQATFKALQARELPGPYAFGGAANLPDAFLVQESDPKLLALGASAYRAGLAGRFGLLYQILGLSPAQVGKFEQLMAAHYEAGIDLRAIARSQGLDDSDPTIAAMQQQQDGEFRAAQLDLLGSFASGQVEQFERAQPARDIAAAVATAVALTPSPLGWAQAEQLTQLLANASSLYQSGGLADPATIEWDAALAQAQGILSAPQFAALRAEYLKLQLDKIHAQFNQRESAAK